MRSRPAGALLVALLELFLVSRSNAARLREFDASVVSRPRTAAARAARSAPLDPALRLLATPAHRDERFDVPTFVWAHRAPGTAAAARGVVRPSVDRAARDHLTRLAPLWRLDAADVEGATLHHVHDTGRGAVIASYRQVVDGVEVFRDEIRVLMGRDRELLAVSGYLPGRRLGASRAAPTFALDPARAVGIALQDFAGTGTEPSGVRPLGGREGGYEAFDPGDARALPDSVSVAEPIRAKRVLYHLPDALEPAWYVEIMGEASAWSYVISAVDGRLLFRHGLSANDSYSYRVWAEATGARIPMDGPQGTAPSPAPSGVPDAYDPPFVAPNLLTLQNGPISTNDPWLPPGATQTTGNNVDAYADLASPDGFSSGDLRATTTSPGVFDRVYDTALAPGASSNQRMAAVTQLFYVNNFLHDWYYDAGFDEAAGNAQASNYARGGVQGDRLRAEAQDWGGTSNANMSTPADGGSPRMQMYVFVPPQHITMQVTAPQAIAGFYQVGTASFGPSSFNLSGTVALAADGTAPASDGCQALTGAFAGMIVLLDRGSCSFGQQAANAQAAGAIGVLIADNVATGSPPQMTGTPPTTITIPVLSVTQAVGASIKNQLALGAVSVTMTRLDNLRRDGTIDDQIVAHEWGHYISNRLIGNGNGLGNNQGGGMGEGWGDFTALLMTVRPEDASAPNGAAFTGAYGLGAYAVSRSVGPVASYYYGVRRYPYSIDFGRNPLTFRHIQDGVALPVGPPTPGNGAVPNSEVHRTGEVWCSMLWECYAALLRSGGRLTFDEARDRMRRDLVAAYQLTPSSPTILEARDALLAAALADDVADHDAFWAAFARRGAGAGATGPDRFSSDNVGVIESYAVGGALSFVDADVDDAAQSCDHDGYVDDGETGQVTVTIRNTGSATLAATTGTVTSGNPAVSFPAGATFAFPASAPFASVSASVPVRVTGASGVQVMDLHVTFSDPSLAAPAAAADFTFYMNVDESPAPGETVEALSPPWTMTAGSWSRIAVAPTDHRFYAPDPGGASDQALVTPPLQVAATGSFSFQFRHAYRFEKDASAFYDGGVLEISTDGGGSWSDIGASASPGYGGTLFSGSGNPLSGRAAWVGQNASYPALDPVTVALGTAYAGKTVRVRFRIGADAGVGDHGWDLDDLAFTNLVNAPFLTVNPEADACAPVAVASDLPAGISFALAGGNPVRGEASFRFALPAPQRVDLAVYDVGGRRVATLASGEYAAGWHAASWSAPRTGASATAGVYFARMSAGGQRFTTRLVVLR